MKNEITNPDFTPLNGCRVTINGWRADIETKLPILLQCGCVITPIDPDHAEEAQALSTAEIEGVNVCSDPQLVEIAMKYHDWINTPNSLNWKDSIPTPSENQQDACGFIMEWIAAHQSQP